MIVHFSDLSALDAHPPDPTGASRPDSTPVYRKGRRDSGGLSVAHHGAFELDGEVPQTIYVARAGTAQAHGLGARGCTGTIQQVRDLVAAQEILPALELCDAIEDDFIRETMRGIILSLCGERDQERALFQTLLDGRLAPVQRSVTLANLADTALLDGDLTEAVRLSRQAMAQPNGDQRPVPWLNLFTAIARQKQPTRRMHLRFETEVRRLQYHWPTGARSPFLQYAITRDPDLEPLHDYLVDRRRRLGLPRFPTDAGDGVTIPAR